MIQRLVGYSSPLGKDGFTYFTRTPLTTSAKQERLKPNSAPRLWALIQKRTSSLLIPPTSSRQRRQQKSIRTRARLLFPERFICWCMRNDGNSALETGQIFGNAHLACQHRKALDTILGYSRHLKWRGHLSRLRRLRASLPEPST